MFFLANRLRPAYSSTQQGDIQVPSQPMVQTGSRIGAVIVAAGRGERAGQSAQGPKQYRSIGGKAVIAHTIEALKQDDRVGKIAVVIHADDADLLKAAAGPLLDDRAFAVMGGVTRQDSVRLGLEALAGCGIDQVLIHDGVRPFVGPELLGRIIDALDGENGVIAAMPVTDTLKRANADRIIAETVSRDGLFAAQTPQAFPFAAILAAHRKAAAQGLGQFTDDAALAEWAGIPVRLVEGSPENVKLTWSRDIAMADTLLSGHFPDVRTGNGYDVHAFEPGTAVVLCGVEIPFERKLAGHSDADVGLHALTDALLATIGAGDIGTHFPPSDRRWKGVASRLFVEHAVRLVREAGGRIANADVTLIAEAPKIGPHREAMTAAMAGMLGIAPGRVSVKATTNERLGFVGRGEGIAAIVTANVIYPGEVPE